ncbi:MAG TPA: hypothetical protein PLC40_12395 [Candidatus Hydrogenedentes bacterium]|nr:MAG: hypothetical protein BWY09_00866 [Candidatus Hydrogenedentes bacterium ADurb.Bin179]HOH30468.1 hypothetical protein [Candidatus Hydrogenedentota bacterium]
MLKKFVEVLKNLVPPPEVFDPSQFNDPLATQVEWTPMHPKGTSFRTHKLVQLHSDRVEFQPAWGLKLFLGIFLFAGAFAPISFVFALAISGQMNSRMIFTILIPIVMGTVIVIVGYMLYYRHSAPIVCDRYSGYFWKGRKAPNEVLNINAIKDACKLEDIHALQLISEYCQDSKSSYYSYELNLVLNTGNRINVVDHGNQEKLRQDAQVLSVFLQVPVWDAIESE